MATVVNVNELQKRFNTLGWTSGITVVEVLNALAAAAVPATDLVAYLDALIASPSGLNDAAIQGCPANVATGITGYFASKTLTVT